MAKKIPAFTPERALLDYLKDAEGGGFQKYKVTQGYIKCILVLSETGALEFRIIGEDNGGISGQQLIPRSDAFWANIFGFFISKLAAAEVGPPAVPAQSPRSLIEQTFPNPYVFTGATELEALQTLYNGSLKIEISDELYFQQLDLKRFKFVGVAQQGMAMDAAATGLFGESEWNPMTGFYECCPNLLLSGESTPKVEIKLPESVDMTGENDTVNLAIMYFRGFYIPDGAKLGKGKS